MFREETLREYLKRSYFAVDGLWFMKVEERSGFDAALEIDVAVWEVLAKIQARKTRQLLGIEGEGVSDLVDGLELKFSAEGYEYEIREKEEHCARVHLKRCPWLVLLRKSGRQHLADEVGGVICGAEFGAWAREFNNKIEFDLGERMCGGSPYCLLSFTLERK